MVVIARRVVPRREIRLPHRGFHYLGAFVVTAGLVGLTYGLIEGPVKGWRSAEVVTSLIMGVIALSVFVVAEVREKPSAPPPDRGLHSSRQLCERRHFPRLRGARGNVLSFFPMSSSRSPGTARSRQEHRSFPVTFLMLLLSARFGALGDEDRSTGC